ncbi:MAG TPA: PDDEXK nuclease domain-containing protein [Pyrinomonadaceae bacterium]|nr:PDDEXK nuclease domain-containing protein [Pyrinomonadaceae bacterium]
MPKKKTEIVKPQNNYDQILFDVVELLEQSRRLAARSINAIMTATYWEIGRRIVEVEQKGEERADYYGKVIVNQLAQDLTQKFGRGLGRRNLFQMRLFYLTYSNIQSLPSQSKQIVQTVSAQSAYTANVIQTAYGKSSLIEIAKYFPLPWSHYVLLLSCKNENAREFYESEALRGGWTVRQLKRQINSQFYERTALSKNKAAMLKKGEKAKAEDFVSPDEEIKDPFVLEFLNLKDEYSELDLEEAIITHLQDFLLEMGTGFTFVGRQVRLRIGDEWYRVDLVLFNRRLRCLVIIDLKLGRLTHADIGQMILYTNYADEHWREEGENPPVGLILCDQNNEALAHYTLDLLPNKVLAKEYRLILPDEKILVEEIKQAKREISGRII